MLQTLETVETLEKLEKPRTLTKYPGNTILDVGTHLGALAYAASAAHAAAVDVASGAASDAA